MTDNSPMRILLIFVDGVGLGDNDPQSNPFCTANTPTLNALSNGHRWLKSTPKQVSERGLFQAVDPRMDIAGRPQSGTGHATIITGTPIPQLIGQHYGPKPNAETRARVDENNFFLEVTTAGKSADLLTAYPPHMLHNIGRGKTLPSSFQQAAMRAGLPLHTVDDVRQGTAISDDWTGHGWRRYLKLDDIPTRDPEASGEHLVKLAKNHDFSMMSHVLTDYIGHRGQLADGVQALEQLDRVLSGVLSAWDDDDGLVILTSDHGNMEKLGDRKHTENDVPFVVIGNGRKAFAQSVHTLADIVPAMRQILL